MHRNADQPSIEVLLETSIFTERDVEKVAAQLDREFDAYVGLVAYSPELGGGPPDVALELLASTLPLASIYVNSTFLGHLRPTQGFRHEHGHAADGSDAHDYRLE